jgi:RNA polymerase sigma-70 factor (ECF subfamily)
MWSLNQVDGVLMANSYGDHLSDEELVILCNERLPGDPRPFTVLVSRYQHQVFATCFRFMDDRQEAEDQAQEVFMRVYRGIRHFEGRAKFSTWLFQITINTCRTALRKRARHPEFTDTPEIDLEVLLPWSESPEETVSAQVEVDMVNQAMEIISEHERLILTLRETDSLSYQEIAAQLGIGISAAKMRVMRARLALRRAYQTLFGETG